MFSVTKPQHHVSAASLTSNVDTETASTARYLQDLDSVANMKVCRVCLAMSVKMYHMSEHKLSVLYKRVTGVEINTEDKLPRMLCWECVARLSTANNFIVKAFKTYSILMNQLNSSKLVTVSDIESINRVHYNLASTLGFKYSKENDSNLFIIKENDEDNDHFNVENDIYYEEREPVSCELIDIDTSISIKDEQIIITESNITDENFTLRSEYLEGAVEQNVPDENNKEANIGGEKDKTKCQNTNSVIRTLNIGNEDNINDEEMTIDKMSDVTDMFEEKHHILGEATEIFKELKHSVTIERNPVSEVLPRCKELRVVLEDIMAPLSNHNTQDTLKQLTAQSSKDSSTARHAQIKEIIEQKNNCVEKTTGTVASNISFLEDDSETSKNIFICDICDTEFDIKSTLIRHIKEHSKEYKNNDKSLSDIDVKNIVFICDYCGYRSFYKAHLIGHINSMHTETVSYNCSHCSYKTYHQTSLSDHVNAKHPKKKFFNCSHCSYKAYKKNVLSAHINAKHTKTNVYNCSHCSYKTYHRGNLRKHINIKHTQMQVYNCPHCIYIAYQKSTLTRHVNAKHTRTKVYNCSLCSYEAFKKSDLPIHINAKHSKIISYNCSYCMYKAYHRGNLNKHINSKHTKTDVYYCSLCNHKTYRKSNLIVHIKAKHTWTL